MKTSELRIGNLLKGSHTVIVASIFDEDSVGIGKGDPYYVHTEKPFSPCLTPIPLTEEWLLSFGFEKLNRDVPAYEKGNLIIEWLFERWTARLYYDAFTSIQIIEVKYVHQIQNLYFALCGEELTIKSE